MATVSVVYEEIPEYEHLKETRDENRYENSDVADKIYVSLQPAVMQRIRHEVQSRVRKRNRRNIIQNLSTNNWSNLSSMKSRACSLAWSSYNSE